MSQTDARIRDFVEARAQPTVMRLQDLESEQAEWLSECLVLTAEVRGHLEVLSRLLAGRRGALSPSTALVTEGDPIWKSFGLCLLGGSQRIQCSPTDAGSELGRVGEVCYGRT